MNSSFRPEIYDVYKSVSQLLVITLMLKIHPFSECFTFDREQRSENLLSEYIYSLRKHVCPESHNHSELYIQGLPRLSHLAAISLLQLSLCLTFWLLERSSRSHSMGNGGS